MANSPSRCFRFYDNSKGRQIPQGAGGLTYCQEFDLSPQRITFHRSDTVTPTVDPTFFAKKPEN